MAVFFSPRIDEIFKFGAGLDKSTRQKNIIFCKGRFVYVFNFDRTFILRFDVGKEMFNPPIGFYSDDYDSKRFFEEGGKIVFFGEGGVRYNKRKICKVPTDVKFEELEEIFDKFITIREGSKGWQRILFPKKDLKLLDEKLSHLEFFRKDGDLIIRQRDLASGNVIELTEKVEVKPDSEILGSKLKLKDFEPVAIRTADFANLFKINNFVTVEVGASDKNFFVVRGDTMARMVGVVATCIYDEMGTVRYALEPSKQKSSKEDLNMACATATPKGKGGKKGGKGKGTKITFTKGKKGAIIAKKAGGKKRAK